MTNNGVIRRTFWKGRGTEKSVVHTLVLRLMSNKYCIPAIGEVCFAICASAIEKLKGRTVVLPYKAQKQKKMKGAKKLLYGSCLVFVAVSTVAHASQREQEQHIPPEESA
jgi:hypothetical protein